MKNRRIPILLAAALIFSNPMDMDKVVAMSKDYPFAITAEAKEKTATVRITGVIWNWGNSSEQFRSQIEKFNADGVNHLHIYINTPGGSVIEANEIVNIIKSFKGKVTGEGGALVASAGTYIALECESFEMSPNGQWMYHKPIARLEGNEDKIESDLVALKNFTADYKARYAERTNLTEAQIEKKWAKGDVWLSPKQALKDGFVTGIKKAPAKITEDTAALMAACGSPKAYTPDTPKQKQKQKPNTMDQLEALALQLGLPKTATQAEVDDKIEALKKAESDNAVLAQKQKDDTAAKAKKDKEDFFAKAVKDKKLDAKQAAGMHAWYDADAQGCIAYVEALPSIDAISRGINGSAAPSAAAEKIGDKDFDLNLS